MKFITGVVDCVNTFLWDYALLFLLVGAGIIFTVSLRFVQIRKFKAGMKALFGNFSLHGKNGENGLSSFQALTTAIAAQVGTGNIAGAATAIAGMKALFGNFSLHGKNGENGLSSFQALTTAIAAQVGTGNIAGAATAIASGGAGAIFWMWVSAFFGMATIYGEAVMAQHTRKHENGTIVGGPVYYIRYIFKGKFGKFLSGFFSVAIILALGFMGNMVQSNENGTIVGGPVYYIRYIFKGKFGKFLSGFFSVAIILALGFMGNMVQSNSIGLSFANAFHVEPLIVGICVAVIAGIIFLGGIKRIARVTEKVVPLMALLYIVGCVVILCMFPQGVAKAIKDIFVGAFAPQAVAGGVLGVTVQKAMRYGVARGLFSNEAGMGSTPHAHATADVKHPCDQGVIAMMGVFIDTFVILTLTALVILSTDVVGTGPHAHATADVKHPCDQGVIAMMGVFIDTFVILTLTALVILSTDVVGTGLTGSELAQSAFDAGFGSFGKIFIAICMLFFAFTTIVGWYYFGEVNVRSLIGEKAVKIYCVLVLGFVVLGSVMKVELVWELSDMFNGLMVLPNLIGLLACLGVVLKLTREYERKDK